MSDTITDEQVLANPGDFSVTQVTEVFARSDAESVAATKALEADGKQRAGILNWTPSPQSQPVASQPPRFARDRVLSRDEGPRICGHPHHVIVGALAGDESPDFSVAEIQAKVHQFVGRCTTPKEA